MLKRYCWHKERLNMEIINGILLLIFCIGIFWSFYRLRRISRIIAEAQKMESVGRLAGGVAHDFNNMLAGICSAAGYIKLHLDKDSELHRYVDIISDSCTRASHLTAQLLMFSRTASDSTMRIDVHAGLEETIYLLRHGLPPDINVEVSAKAQKHIVCGYPDAFHNLIINLGLNSRDSMPQGGTIRILTDNVTLSRSEIKRMVLPASPGEFLHLCVSDTGSGIPKEILSKIFDPFFTTKAEGEGTGLGLPAVYGIVKRHNGTLKIETSPAGTDFHVYLPLAPADSKLPLYHARTSCRLPGSLNYRILIVDDEPVLLEVLKAVLEEYGADVVCADNGSEALEIYQDSPESFDLIMLDVIMKAPDGIAVYHVLRGISPCAKVVFMSGYNEDTVLNDILQNDNNAVFISKPYQIPDILDKVSRLLGKN